MKINSVNDLKAMDPELLKKLGLRKINASDIAKLGLRVFNAGDITQINTKPFDINDLAPYGLKNFYTTESVEHWLNNLTSKSQPKQHSTQQNDRPANLTTYTTDSSANLQQTTSKAGSRPYPRRWWPFLWGRPAFDRPRKDHYSASSKQEEKKEKLPQDSESTSQQTSEVGQKISPMNLPLGSEINNVNLDKQVITNSEDSFEGNLGTIFDYPPGDNKDVNSERIFQLESVKKGIEIKRNTYKNITFKSLAHMCNRNH